MKLSASKALGLLKRTLTTGRPYHAQWFLTDRCNYRCRTCDVWRNLSSTEELSTDKVKEGLEVLRKLGVIELVLTGGNPLLREDIGEIIESASRFFLTTVYDNGSTVLERIEALRKADFVAISLDSLDEKKNDYMRGVPGATEKALNAIEALRREGISVAVAPTVSQANVHEMIGFTKHFIDRGIPVWYAIYSFDSPTENSLFGIGHKSDEFEFSVSEDVSDFLSSLMQLKKERQGVFMPDKVISALQRLFVEQERTWKCRALRSFFMINPRGEIAGCHHYPPATDIFNVVDLWDSLKFQNLRNHYAKCTECTYLCYIFYSLYHSMIGSLNLILDQAKNVRTLVEPFS